MVYGGNTTKLKVEVPVEMNIRKAMTMLFQSILPSHALRLKLSLNESDKRKK